MFPHSTWKYSPDAPASRRWLVSLERRAFPLCSNGDRWNERKSMNFALSISIAVVLIILAVYFFVRFMLALYENVDKLRDGQATSDEKKMYLVIEPVMWSTLSCLSLGSGLAFILPGGDSLSLVGCLTLLGLLIGSISFPALYQRQKSFEKALANLQKQSSNQTKSKSKR